MPPWALSTSTHFTMHASHIWAEAPATRRSTSWAPLRQNAHSSVGANQRPILRCVFHSACIDEPIPRLFHDSPGTLHNYPCTTNPATLGRGQVLAAATCE